MQQAIRIQNDFMFLPTQTYPNRRFKIVTKLGEGAEGQVYLAKPFEWGNFQQDVAIKVERQIDQNISEIILKVKQYQEQENNQSPDNYSQIIRIYELSQYDNQSITIMEVGEKNIYNYLSTMKGQLTMQQKLKILRQITQSIYFLHSQNYMHRDIKPENFMKVGQDYKLIDFGLTKDSSLLYKTANIGSKLFQAPEMQQGSQNYSTSVDIWSLGCVFYEILSEEQFPIDRTNIHLNIIPQSSFPTQVEMNLQNLVSQMLQIDPSKRITAQQVWQEVKKIEGQIFQQTNNQNSQFCPAIKFGQMPTQNQQISTISTFQRQNFRSLQSIQNPFQNTQIKANSFPIFNSNINDQKDFIKQQFDEFKIYFDQKLSEYTQTQEQKQIEFKVEIHKKVDDQIEQIKYQQKTFEEQVSLDLSNQKQYLSTKVEEQEKKSFENFEVWKNSDDQKNIIEQLRNLNQCIADQTSIIKVRKAESSEENLQRQIIKDELQEIRDQQSTIQQKFEQLEKQQIPIVNNKKPQSEKCEALKSSTNIGYYGFYAENNETISDPCRLLILKNEFSLFKKEIIELMELNHSNLTKSVSEEILDTSRILKEEFSPFKKELIGLLELKHTNLQKKMIEEISKITYNLQNIIMEKQQMSSDIQSTFVQDQKPDNNFAENESKKKKKQKKQQPPQGQENQYFPQQQNQKKVCYENQKKQFSQ